MMDSLPAISVITRTVAGRGAFLERAITSIIQQDYPPLEVLIVEDGSNTAAPVVAALQAQTHIPLRYMALPKSGRCVAGNTGLEASKGEACCFLDDDDEFFPAHLRLLAKALAENPTAPAVYALSEMRPTVVHSLQPLKLTEKPVKVAFAHGVPFWPTIVSMNMMPIQAVVFRRQCFVQHGGFNETLDHFEDWDLWLRYAQAGWFVPVDAVTSFYRMPATSRAVRARYQTAQQYLPLIQQAIGAYQLPVTLSMLDNATLALIARQRKRLRLAAYVHRHALLYWGAYQPLKWLKRCLRR